MIFICHFPSNLPLSPRRQGGSRAAPGLLGSASSLGRSSCAQRQPGKQWVIAGISISFIYFSYCSTGCRPEGTEMHQPHSPCIIPNVADLKGQVHGQSITNRKKWDGVGMVAPGWLGDTVSTWPLLSIFRDRQFIISWFRHCCPCVSTAQEAFAALAALPRVPRPLCYRNAQFG